jgi:hypothetical protein
VEQIPLTDDACQLSLFIDDWKVPNAPDFHDVVRHEQAIVPTQRHQFSSHHVAHQFLVRVHATLKARAVPTRISRRFRVTRKNFALAIGA